MKMAKTTKVTAAESVAAYKKRHGYRELPLYLNLEGGKFAKTPHGVYIGGFNENPPKEGETLCILTMQDTVTGETWQYITPFQLAESCGSV